MSEQWKTKICTRHSGCTDVVTLDDIFIVCVRGDKPEVAESIVREHNAHDALVAACENARFAYDYIICRTPTGPTRNRLTEQNILRMQALTAAKGEA